MIGKSIKQVFGVVSIILVIFFCVPVMAQFQSIAGYTFQNNFWDYQSPIMSQNWLNWVGTKNLNWTGQVYSPFGSLNNQNAFSLRGWTSNPLNSYFLTNSFSGQSTGLYYQSGQSFSKLSGQTYNYFPTVKTAGSLLGNFYGMGATAAGSYGIYSSGSTYYSLWQKYVPPCKVKEPEQKTQKTQANGLMLLIEFEGVQGLNNFAYELQERDIPSLLIVTADFVAANCENIKTLQKYGVEVGGVYPQEPFWDVPYETQFEAMKNTRDTIEACTGKPMRVFGTRYFAYDENTLKAAEALGIPYVLARGTTGARATIYKPAEYDVKVFSVSNVSSENWGTGSLCDYSYWAREGSPEEFGEELFAALEHDKISPVSHTYIGGLKAAWNAEYLNFFDQADVDWMDLDEFGSVDINSPLSEIPDNREVQYTTPKPLVPLDEEPNVNNPCAIDDFPPLTEGLMLLIEYESVDGLTNFVYQLQEREIPSLLLATADFVTQNCETIRTLQDYGLEVVAHTGPELWGVPYEEQYTQIKNATDAMEACLGRPVRIISSRYMGSDENTWRVAEDLGIPYVLARGTTGTRSTIYQPEGFNVKIIAVSNMDSEQWAYGSLCDYSIWARGGTPEQFSAELYDALQHNKICTVSHTRISGLKAAWYNVYMEFLDNSGVKYLSIDDFTTVDITLPILEIPQNRNVPYASSPYPQIPLDEEPNVDNPCAINDFPPVSGSGGNVGEKIVVFHNGTGPMCLEFLDFIDTITYPVEEHISGDEGFWDALDVIKSEFGTSEGVSENFGYFPIIFIQDKAYSGFNDDITNAIISLISG